MKIPTIVANDEVIKAIKTLSFRLKLVILEKPDSIIINKIILVNPHKKR